MKNFLLAFLLTTGFAAAAQTEQELVNIEYLINNGRGNAVYSDLNAFIKKYPSNPQAYFLRAKYYFQNKNHKAALQDIDIALKFSPLNADYHELKGGILFLGKKYSQAGESFEKAFQTGNSHENCRYKAAESFFSAKNFQRAETLLKGFAENDSAKLLLTKIQSENGDNIAALKTVNTIEKKNADFYFARGVIYGKSEMYERSIDDLNTALDLNPSLTEIYLWRGLSYYFSGQKQNARQDWNTALKHRHFKANDYLEKYR